MSVDFDFQLNEPALVRQQCYIDGQWCDADSGKTLEVSNPANGQVIAQVPFAGPHETLRAIEAAEKALPAWRAKTAAERAAILRRWFELLLKHKDDLGRLMTLEQGKP